jgi:hypothetical protein
MRRRTNFALHAGVGAIAVLGVVLPVTAAAAAPYPSGGTPPSVSPNQAGTTVAAKTVSTAPSALPFTGADIAELAAIGAAATGAGVVLVRRARRTSTA